MTLPQVYNNLKYNVGFQSGSAVKNPLANAGDPGDAGSIPGLGRPLKKEKATYSSILAWEIPWTEDTGRLQSMRSKKSHAYLSN